MAALQKIVSTGTNIFYKRSKQVYENARIKASQTGLSYEFVFLKVCCHAIRRSTGNLIKCDVMV